MSFDNAGGLWWLMLATGLVGAILSIVATIVDSRRVAWPTARQRYLIHLTSYGFMTLSILAFILRGLSTPA
jgi:hypothetical protein